MMTGSELTITRTRKSLTTAGLLVFVLVFAMSLATGIRPEAAQAHCVRGSADITLTVRQDRFRNWDYESERLSKCNIDWPVDFLFWNNAEVTKIKSAMEPLGYGNDCPPNCVSPMHTKMDDGDGWVWDEDKGVKNSSGPDACVGDVEHVRLYAVDGDDRMYNLDWGYYVLGTAHIDHNEVCSGSWSGRSETAEHRIAEDLRGSECFPAVAEDWGDFYNDVTTHTADDGHRLENDGYATAVDMPSSSC